MPRQPVGRWQWTDLPAEAQAAVTAKFGAVLNVESAPPGLTPGLASRLHTEAGTVFLKAIPVRSPAVDHYRRERAVADALPPHVPAPALCWSAEISGWLLLAFEHIAADPADLTPGSPDIPAVLDTLAALARHLSPSRWPDSPSLAERLAPMSNDGNIEPPAGDTLLHTDLHPGNLLVNESCAVHVIDWSLACRGPAWVEAAWFAPRLVTAGHSPQHADRLLQQRVPAWAHAPRRQAIEVSAVQMQFRERMASTGPHRSQHQTTAAATRAWHTYLTSGSHAAAHTP